MVLLQGYEPSNAVARIAAQHLGIPFLALENSALSNRMLWDNVSGITTNRNLAKNYFWRHKNSVSDEMVIHYCDELIANTKDLKSAEHTSPGEHRSVAAEARPSVLFLGQVFTDSSVLFGLNRWNSPVEIIEQCAHWCKANQYDLIIKLHPKESNGVNPIDCEPYRSLTSRKIKACETLSRLISKNDFVIDHDNRFDTYELIQNSELVVTLNSQSGLEAAFRDKPVVVCGDAFYGNLGFTIDASAPQYFESAMTIARESAKDHIDHPISRSMQAQRFTYIFFEKYCRPKSVDGLLQLIEDSLP